VAQIDRFLGVLAHQRETLEQQRADIEMSLAEIAVHEEECRSACWKSNATPPDNESSLDVYVNVTPRYYSVTLHQRTSNRRSERRQ
jgi:hypothetical protein